MRRRLDGHRHELAAAADRLYPATARAGSTRLLTRDGWTATPWTLATPLDLREVRLGWVDDAPAPAVTGREPEAAALLPEGAGAYPDALGTLARPRLFEDRTCYRLLDVAWPELTFTRARYFDGVSVGEAAAHEFAAYKLAGQESGEREPAGQESGGQGFDRQGFDRQGFDGQGFGGRGLGGHERAGHGAGRRLPFRTLVGDPTDLRRRPALCAISTLTLRRDRRTGETSFVLHWRDPAKVAHGGGLFQVMPVGVFQPAHESAGAEKADLDLWKCVVREYAEEFLGRGEEYGDGFDYESWPFYRLLTDAREDGRVRCHVLGVGVDPLTFATDFLTVTVLEAETFDAAFGEVAASNSEGRIVGRVPFDAETVRRHVRDEPMQAAGAAVLDLAWRHREALL
ncbi:transcriptional regulator [Microbispora hainanensis]|uniref:Transcriptional regulator n=1 Tax=Microbispora hainanensis TaxID=568844 RepID=A0A544YKL2_9ACTN|nr:transcriptional regulator [Microbispora hainanensis]TQS17276.1 transcriptional regulator [Microbispora hainanensis]